MSVNSLAITIDVVSDKEVVAPGEQVPHRIVVANDDSVTRTNVVVTSNVPAGTSFADGAAFPIIPISVCGFTCTPGDTPTWELGDIPAGGSRAINVLITVGSGTADSTDLVFMTTLSHDDDSDAGSSSVTTVVDTSPVIDIRTVADQQTIIPGDDIEFEVAFGNISSSGLASTELRASIPSGTTFISASDGGVQSGSQIVWNTGVLNGGEAEIRRFVVSTPDNIEGAQIFSTIATFSGSGNELNTAEELVTTREDIGLNLEVTVVGDPSVSGSFVDYRYVVSNTDVVSKTDVQLVLQADNNLRFSDGASFPVVPIEFCGFVCGDSAEDYAIYNIGELTAGESRVVNIRMNRNGPVEGEVLATRAFLQDGTNEFTLGRVATVIANDEQSLNLVVSASDQLIESSETFEYELAFGNVGDSAQQNLVMELDLPSGVTFVSATDGGTESNGVVSWSLGTVNAGEGSKRFVTVQAPAGQVDGTILASRARLHVGGPSLARASESVVINEDTGLNLEVTVVGDPSVSGSFVDYRYVVSNTDVVSKTDVQLVLQADNNLRFSDGASFPVVPIEFCGFVCGDSAEDYAIYNMGELTAGESRVVNIRMNRNGPVEGEVLATRAFLQDGTNEFTLGRVATVIANDEQSLNLVVSASDQLIESSETFEYELAFGNVGDSAQQNLVMELDLPAGVTFVSATDGGTESNGVVSWALGTVNAGVGGKRFVTVQAPAGQVDGTILASRARLHVGGPSLARASESVVINEDTGLNLEVTVVGDPSVSGSFVDYRYVVSNTDVVSKTDVQLVLQADNNLRFSDGASFPVVPIEFCGFVCGDSAEDYAIYNIGELTAGESRVVNIRMNRNGPVEGEVLATRAFLQDGTNEFTLGRVATVIANDEQSLNLVVSASDQLIESSETFEYELAFGNVGDSAQQNLVMELDLPSGVTFVSATDGGTESNGVVSWSLGTVNAGEGSKRFVTVQAPAGQVDGTILANRARLHVGGPSLARASESVVINQDTGLTLNVVNAGSNSNDFVYLDYVIANTDSVSKTDVVLRVRADDTRRFSDGSSIPTASGCSFTCGDNSEDLASYNLGELLPGESRVISIVTFRSNSTPGEVQYIQARLTEGTNEFELGNTFTHIELNDRAAISITSDDYIVAPGSNQNFSVAMGNPTASALDNALAIVEIPEGYSFVSASGTNAVVGNTVQWPLGNLDANSWRNETLVLQTNSGLNDAEVLEVRAQLKESSGLIQLQDASVATVIDNLGQLELELSTGLISPLTAASTITTNLSAVNNSSNQVVDVEVRYFDSLDFLFSASAATPAAGNCSFNCGDSNEDWALWDLGNIDAGDDSVITFNSTSSTSAANLDVGSLQIASARASHGSNNSHDVALRRVIGVGAQFSVDPDHDSDNDGIPDVWELQFGLDRLTDDANEDLDGDGATNLEEFLGGSDPSDPTSLPACVVVAAATGPESVRETLSGTLDASSTNSSVSVPLSFSWSQLSGPAVAIDDANAAVTSFTVPELDADAEAVFQVTVGSTCDDNMTATVTVDLINNQAPNASAGPDQSDIEIGETVTLNGTNSSDPENDELSFSWAEQSSFGVSLSDSTIANPSFTAPNPGSGGGALTFELTVTDSFGDSDTDTVIVNVDSCPPVADAGSNQAVGLGETFLLDSSNSSDSCDTGSLVSFAWVQTAGDLADISDPAAASPIVTAPNVAGTLMFELTVTDNDGFSDSDTVSVTVTDEPLPELACRAGVDQSVDEGDLVTLNGASSTISDPDLSIAFMWDLIASTDNSMITLSAPDSAETTFVAPDVDTGASQSHTFRLTCSVELDGATLIETDDLIVNVGALNEVPVADAGDTQSVNEGVEVTLDATGSSDPEGDTLSFLWTQESGPSVTLSSTTDAQPTFTAPEVPAEGAMLRFAVTVSDGSGGVDDDEVVVNVINVNTAPVADAGDAASAEEGSEVALDASGSSDIDGDALSFSWVQVSGPSVSIVNADNVSASFTAPEVSENTPLTFEVSVSDGVLEDDATVTITVTDVVDDTQADDDGGDDDNGGDSGNDNDNGSDSDNGASGGGSSGGGSLDVFMLLLMTLSVVLARRRRL